MRLSEAALGLVVALAADSPEITSAITASAHGQASIGAGVVLGSNVFNLAALLGLGAIVARHIHLHRRVVVLEGLAALWVAIASVVTVSTGLGAPVGLALVLFAVVPYIIVSTSSSEMLRKLRVPRLAVTWIRRVVAEEESELLEAIHPTKRGRFDVSVGGSRLGRRGGRQRGDGTVSRDRWESLPSLQSGGRRRRSRRGHQPPQCRWRGLPRLPGSRCGRLERGDEQQHAQRGRGAAASWSLRRAGSTPAQAAPLSRSWYGSLTVVSFDHGLHRARGVSSSRDRDRHRLPGIRRRRDDLVSGSEISLTAGASHNTGFSPPPGCSPGSGPDGDAVGNR